jgi:hypothetical protein
VDAAVTFWKGLGIVATLTGDHASNVFLGRDENKISFLAGPRYTLTAWKGRAGVSDPQRLQLFGQGLVGVAHVFAGSSTSANELGVQAGGGANLYLTKKFGIRPIEAYLVRTQRGPDGYNTQNDIQLAAAVFYHFDVTLSFKAGIPPPVTLRCSANPTAVFRGEPLTVTAEAGFLNPKLNAIYSWSEVGVSGSTATATVDTAPLTAGVHTVSARVAEGTPGKEGLKPGEAADCSTSFMVKEFEPPTVSCSASPSTITPGESSTITAVGVSPQNRPLTYNYSASAGMVSGSGATATFSSAGAPTGMTGITCNVSDDKGQTATASASVTITAPYLAPAPHTQALCSIAFDRNKLRPTRVDNEAKACLDEVALDLQKQADATVVVLGESNAAEKSLPKHARLEDLASERAVNTKAYLVTEKGIDASRIRVAIGTADGQKVENYLVPAGAEFDVPGITQVDESVVKPQERKHTAAKAPRKKAAKR